MEELKAGQIYRVGIGEEAGNIIKIGKAYDHDFNYVTLRGKPASVCAGLYSPFAFSLTLLTGKEIGKAIRKWDADHAKKPKPEYNEVKRPAKAGEYIKVVHAKYAKGYKNGDVLLVTDKIIEGAVRCKNIPICICNDEYVVLEPKAGVKEVRRPAKVGEYVKIVSSHNLPAEYNIGEIHKVTSDTAQSAIFSGIDVDGDHVVIPHESYVVLEGYKCKHFYTAKQIKQAKELLGQMMVEALGDKATGVMFVKEKKNITCLLNADDIDDISSGKATCNKQDEFNTWIGRCVALCKALHKPIPAFITEG